MFACWQLWVVHKALCVIVSPCGCNVSRAQVPISQVEFADENGLNVQDWHILNKYFRLLVVKHHCFHVKPCTLNEQTWNVPAIRGFSGDLRRVCEFSYLSVNSQLVKFVFVFLALLLWKCNHVRVWDLDAWQPRARWFTILYPVVVLVYTCDELVHPWRQFLVGERCECFPTLRDEPVLDVFVDYFQFSWHTYESLDHVWDIFEVRSDSYD